MSACCSKIKNLGCVSSCDEIQTGETASVTGTYILEAEGIRISADIDSGDEIIFSGGNLNEDSITVFKIKDPNGTYIETAAAEDCFQVSIAPNAIIIESSDLEYGSENFIP